MNHRLIRSSIVRNVAVVAVTALGLAAGASRSAFGGDLNIGIGINLGDDSHHHHHDDAPPPPPAPFRIEVVDEYDRYCVGDRRALYDADWRLRVAECEQFRAQQALDAARRREGDAVVAIDEQQAIVAQASVRLHDSDDGLIAARVAFGRSAQDAADLRARIVELQARVEACHNDFRDARHRKDGNGMVDADNRAEAAEAGIAAAAVELQAIDGRAARLHECELAAAAHNDDRIRLTTAEARLPDLRVEFAAAHEDVFVAEQRVNASLEPVAIAMHDRDEALWRLHRAEICDGHAEFAVCGFHVDYSHYDHRHYDEVALHDSIVRPASYWVDHPAEIQVRVVEVDQVTEVTHVRTIEHNHEVTHIREVETVETSVPVDSRRAYFDRAADERRRLDAERTERAAAEREHRAARISDDERNSAKALALKVRATDHSTDVHASVDLRDHH
jgi:hypothetical protein